MRVSPDTMTRVASSEMTTMRLDSDVVVDTVTLHDCLGIVRGLPVTDNTVTMPPLPAPDLRQLDWAVDKMTLFTTYCEVVSRHYFRLDDLRAYGDAQDDFDKMDEESLYLARQAATEIFELNARRSFVHRIGSTKDYGHETLLNLAHTDVYKMMTEGYTLVSDCQAAPSCALGTPYPRVVEYLYGADQMPAQVSRAVLELAAYMLRPSNRPLGATGESSDAGYIHFTTAGRDGATDIPEVNAAIEQFGRGAQLIW